MTDINDAIKRAHALEIHPSNALSTWTDRALSAYPANPVNTDIPENNALMRVTYATDDTRSVPDLADGDLHAVVPLDDTLLSMAASVSTYSDVFGVALYTLYPDGTNEPYPSIAFADGNRVM